jgi:hypothetical protein
MLSHAGAALSAVVFAATRGGAGAAKKAPAAPHSNANRFYRTDPGYAPRSENEGVLHARRLRSAEQRLSVKGE